MLDACSQAVQGGDCQLSSSVPESTRPESVALVLWQDAELLHATVRVGRRDREWVSRQLAFSPGDPQADRWTTVGLTVATLIDETRAPHPAAQPSPAVAARPALPQPSTLVPSADDRAAQRRAFTVGGILGNGWDHGGLQTGAWASFALGWPRLPLFGVASASYGASRGPSLGPAGALESRWASLALGAGLETWLQKLDVRLYAAPELAFQLVSASVAQASGQLDSQELELRLRAGMVFQPWAHFGLMLGGTARLLPFRTGAEDATRAQSTGFGLLAMAGVEVRL